MEDTRNVHQSQEEAERYKEALGSLLTMQEIFRSVRAEMTDLRRGIGTCTRIQQEKMERMARDRFIRCCDRVEINAMPYVKGVTMKRAINTINSEIRSFEFALNVGSSS